jgi:hypothetical protein
VQAEHHCGEDGEVHDNLLHDDGFHHRSGLISRSQARCEEGDLDHSRHADSAHSQLTRISKSPDACTHTVLAPSSTMILTLVRVFAESLKIIGLNEKARAASVIAFTAAIGYHSNPFEHLSGSYTCGFMVPQ